MEENKIEWYSPMLKGVLRGMSRQLKGKEMKSSSVYGTMLVLDSMTRKGGGIYVIALSESFGFIDIKREHISLVADKELFVKQTETWCRCVGAEYIVIGKAGALFDYIEELHFASDIFGMLEAVKLYDYLTVDNDSYFSYMDKLI